MPPRLKEIADALNLSVTTVSRALAGYPDVSEKTRQRVVQTAREMGYVPNVAARHLQRQKANAIGFIIPTFGPRFSDPFFSELIAGIGNEAGRRGYDLLISTVPPGPRELETYRLQTYSGRVDGLVIVRTRLNDPRIAFLSENDFPFVSFGSCNQPMDFPFVDVDGEYGTRLAVEHLIELGHTRIAYLTGPRDLSFSVMRLRGFVEAIEQHGVPVREEWILEGGLTEGDGHSLAMQLLAMQPHPTAVIAANDLMAIGVMGAVQEKGLEVGKDVSVIGFDDISLAAYSHPPLTTIHQPIYSIGTKVTSMLIQILEGNPPEEKQIWIKPHLVIRKSTGKAPRNTIERG